ncbi:MAG: lipocalin-like domain-containing protein [Bacteroidaceae bacterium]|nr:lipocalin-like domain-containing protein [Bacteroidaceae bacterium]
MNIPNKLCILSIICLIFLLPTACSQAPDNGDLDGMWHLRSVEKLANDSVMDVKEKRIYYSFQLRLISLRRSNLTYSLVGRFNHEQDSLTLHSFVILNKEDQLATKDELKPFYLDSTQSNFGIVKLNKNQLIIRSNEQELCFKKF